MLRKYIEARTKAKLAKADYWAERKRLVPQEIKEEVAERKRVASCRHTWEELSNGVLFGQGEITYICPKCLTTKEITINHT